MNILLAVTGSISAYKALDICRGLTKSGYKVRVITSKGADEFINSNTFHYLGAEQVYSRDDDFNLKQYDDQMNVLHIDLVKWMDKLIIAPTSANTIAKLANGFCDDLLSCVFLALGAKSCIIFPAMNTQMLEHPMTQTNLTKLRTLENVFVHPTLSGELACGDVGVGKLAPVEQILDVIEAHSFSSNKKTVLITTGATISPLDPIRYITNPSSGKTGYEFAKKYLAKGYKVILICGYNTIHAIENLRELPAIKIKTANTTQEMKEVVHKYFASSDIYISTAAISDIEFRQSEHKLKKNKLENILKFNAAPDILASVLEKRKKQIIVGFAAETSDNEDIFLEKWNRKPVDLLVGNIVNSGARSNGKGLGFNKDSNKYYFIKNGKVIHTQELTKAELALTVEQQVIL